MFEEVERPSILREMLRFMLLEFVLCSAAVSLAIPLMAIESFGKEPHSHFIGVAIALVIGFAMGKAISRSSPRLAPLNCWAWLFPGTLLVLGILQELLQPPPISSVPSEYDRRRNWDILVNHPRCRVDWLFVRGTLVPPPLASGF